MSPRCPFGKKDIDIRLILRIFIVAESASAWLRGG
jgi:hypothetical protein